MPRRKQDCPKRMKWEEGGSGADQSKEGEESTEGEGDKSDSTVALSAAATKEAAGSSGSEDEAECSGSSSSGGEEKEEPQLSKRVDNRLTVSDDSAFDKQQISSSNMAVEEPPPPEPPLEERKCQLTPIIPLVAEEMAASNTSHKELTAVVSRVHTPSPSAPHFHPTIDHRGGGQQEEEAVDEEDEEEMTSQDGPLDFSFKKQQAPVVACRLPSPCPKEKLTPSEDGPLDLSVSSSRKRPRSSGVSSDANHVGIMQHVNAHLGHMMGRKSLRLDANSSLNSNNSNGSGNAKPSSPWSNQFPFRFSPSSSPNSGVEVPLWNGGVKGRSTPSPSTTTTGSSSHHHNHYSQLTQETPTPPTSTQQRSTDASTGSHPVVSKSGSGSGAGRHNAWQSHWLSRGADQAKDVLKCVWCRKSFRSLEEMTAHMKEARHCGMHVPQQSSLVPPPPPPPPPPALKGNSCTQKKVNGDEQQQGTGGGGGLLKEQTTLPMPRKLVRGQDVWLGKGAEQTKQILKCMWCGQSFKTLAEMTTHMQQTQHYTNIISQEQIISWKSPEDKMASSGQAHVNAVLTCKVCDQAFSSLKELSNHMVKNSHYKEHILRSITENGGRRRQTREKRKKSLPVRKLLELERAQNEMNRLQQQEGDVSPHPTATVMHSSSSAHRVKSSGGSAADGRINCEKCGRRIETQAFVEHIRLCVGGGGNHSGGSGDSSSHRTSSSSISSLSTLIASVSPSSKDKRSSSPRKQDSNASSSARLKASTYTSPILPPTCSSPSGSQLQQSNGQSDVNSVEAPSVLNAIEKLIEKSFDGKQQRNSRYVTSSNNPGSNRTTPSSAHTPLSQPPPATTPSHGAPPDKETDDEQHHHHHHQQRLSDDETADEDEDDDEMRMMGKELNYQKLVIDEQVSVNRRHEEEVEEEKMRQKSKKRMRRNSRLSSPAEVEHRPPSSNIRASPMSTSSRRDAASPARSLESPGSCSNCSSHGTLGGSSAGGGLALVRSSPSPSSPNVPADHPLKELQKLLDKTNVSLSKSTSASVSVVREALSPGAQSTSPSALLAYGAWPSNLLEQSSNLNTSDVFHCNFCDNSFMSKSAFRHHMAKAHAKDHNSRQLIPSSGSNSASSSTAVTPLAPLNMSVVSSANTSCRISSPSSSSSSSSSSANSPANNLFSMNNPPSSNNNNNNKTQSKPTTSASSVATSAPVADDSPHSKFLKYTELAKQLSSKYV